MSTIPAVLYYAAPLAPEGREDNWTIDALSPVDFPVIAAGVLVSAVLIVIANLIVDIVYSLIDPRVRLA